MVKRLNELEAAKKRVTFDRDAILNTLDNSIEEEKPKLVQQPTDEKANIDIVERSKQYYARKKDRDFIEEQMRKQQSTKPKTFGQAFSKARKEGKKTFWYNGKQYTTQLKESNANNKSNNKNNTNKNITNNNNNSTKKNVSSSVNTNISNNTNKSNTSTNTANNRKQTKVTNTSTNTNNKSNNKFNFTNSKYNFPIKVNDA